MKRVFLEKDAAAGKNCPPNREIAPHGGPQLAAHTAAPVSDSPRGPIAAGGARPQLFAARAAS
jgi:hypothetical protein